MGGGATTTMFARIAIRLTVGLLLFGIISCSAAEAWSAIESERFVVMHNESEKAARNVLNIAEGFYPKVTSDLGYSPKRKITIWFCRTQKEFGMAVNAPIQDWAAGCAYPLRARIVVRDPAYVKEKRLNLSRLVKHEITHVVFGLYVDDNLKHVPVWFNEGLAMYEAEQWTYGQYWTMLTGALSNSLIPFSQLTENFPQGEQDARMAYAQSCSIVTFIVREYGDEALRQCVSLIAEGRNMDEAFAGSIGRNLT